MRFLFSFCLMLLLAVPVFGQPKYASKLKSQYTILWQTPGSVKPSENITQKFLNFSGAQFVFEDAFLPRFSDKIALPGNNNGFTVSLIREVYEPLTLEETAIIKNPSLILSDIKVDVSVSTAKKQNYGVYSFIPLRKNASTGNF